MEFSSVRWHHTEWPTRLSSSILDTRKAKEHYKSFIIKENRKPVKLSEIITYQPKILQNPNIVDKKLIITGDPKTLNKLSKTIRQAKKAGSNSSFYSDAKTWKFFEWKNIKITKHAFKDYASSYNVEILNTFNPELQLNPIQDGLFRDCSRMRGEGGKKAPLPKICHTYPTITKLGKIIPYLKRIQKIYESSDTPIDFCWHRHFFTGNQQILLCQKIRV